MNRQQTYLFCYLRTGGGHLAPARSVARYIEQNHGGGVRPVLVDGLVEARPYARFIIEDGYRLLQAKAKWYYEFLYATNKFPPIGYLNVALASMHIRPYLRKRIVEERPATIVLFHFFLIAPVHEILKELGLDIPVITVVTDPFTAHPLWFQKESQRYIVFSERLKKYCMDKRRIPKEKIALFPFIIDEKFSAPLPAEGVAAAKERFGFAAEKKAVLIIGGGDGIPHGKTILDRLLRTPIDAEIAIVCGKNKELYDDARRFQQQYPSLKVFGFVDFVYELLNASDIVVTKCGASTIMEILMMRKIPVINDYLWEQELGNMEFVRDNRLGIFERNIARLPEIIRSLTGDAGVYRSYQDRIASMKVANGTKDVAEYILALHNHHSKDPL